MNSNSAVLLCYQNMTGVVRAQNITVVLCLAARGRCQSFRENMSHMVETCFCQRPFIEMNLTINIVIKNYKGCSFRTNFYTQIAQHDLYYIQWYAIFQIIGGGSVCVCVIQELYIEAQICQLINVLQLEQFQKQCQYLLTHQLSDSTPSQCQKGPYA